MARFLVIAAFARHASAVMCRHGILGIVIRNHGICTARFGGKRKPRHSWYSNRKPPYLHGTLPRYAETTVIQKKKNAETTVIHGIAAFTTNRGFNAVV